MQGPCLCLSKVYQSLSRTNQLYALFLKTHLPHGPFYATRLLRFYAINGDLRSARQVVDKSPHRSVYLWNSIIRVHAQAYRFEDVFSLFAEMRRTDIKPDNFTYACIVRACAGSFDLDGLKLVHCGVMVLGLGLDSICSSALVSAYSRLSLIDEEAYYLILSLPEPVDSGIRGALLLCCDVCGNLELAEIVAQRPEATIKI